MKWLLISSLALTSLVSEAAGLHFDCRISQNLKVIAETSVVVSSGQKNVSFGGFEEFEFFLSSLGGDKYELQTLNKMEPARSYATAHINSSSPELELSNWTREFLIETRCQVSNE